MECWFGGNDADQQDTPHSRRKGYGGHSALAAEVWTLDKHYPIIHTGFHAMGSMEDRPYAYRRGFVHRRFFLRFFGVNAANLSNASVLPMPRMAIRATSCALRGRDVPCSQL